MANSVDPDQTAPSGAVWSGSALFAFAILSDTLVYKIFGHLLYKLIRLICRLELYIKYSLEYIHCTVKAW